MRILAYLGADATKFRNFDAQTHEAALAMKLAAASSDGKAVIQSFGGALSEKDRKTAMVTTGRRLAEQIGKGNERIIFSIINKFGTAIELPECYNGSPDMIVLVDEGHRSQNGENNIRMQQAVEDKTVTPYYMKSVFLS